MKLEVRPISMNMAYRGGKRYKTLRYKQFINDCMVNLKPMKIPKGNLEFHIQIGVSNKGFDLDNCLKPFIDILQKKYGFNDNRIYHIGAYKRIVPKGEEYISFDIFGAIEDGK